MSADLTVDLLDEWVRIPLADGRFLAARLLRPAGGGKVPAILDIAPYRAFDFFRPLGDRLLRWWAQQGYAVLAIDTSGAGGASGLMRDEYLPQEIDDAVAAVAWTAAQTWCDGGVGLSGLSWAAFTALRAAGRAPPALKAMVLGGVSEDGWTTDVQNLGGATYAARVDWAGVMLMFNALPPDPKQYGEGWREAWLARLKANRPWIIPWLSHPERDSYWQAKAAPISGTVPLLLYSGWADKYATSVLRIAASWKGPVRTIIGPWEHAVPDVAARGPQIGFLQEALRWWDRWLKGRDTGVMKDPPLRLWVGEPDRTGALDQGRWRAMSWPMESGSSLALGFGTGQVVLPPNPAPPQQLDADLYEDVPGAWPTRGAMKGPIAPTDMDIVAAPVLSCRLRSNRAGGLLVARLLDIAPDGQAVRMTTAALNLAFHNGSGPSAPPAPGEWTEVVLPFQATAWRLKAGHRLGLSLSADGWPTLWPDRTGATLTLDRASLILSVPLASDAPYPRVAFAQPVTAPGSGLGPAKGLNPANEPLLVSGLTGTLAYAPPAGAYHLDATATDYYRATRFELGLCDGGRQAVAAKMFRVAFERPDWSVRIATRLVVRSTPAAFQIDWTVQALENGRTIYDHSDATIVPRSAV